ncbi:hypothetical protein [Flavobacterium sp.]|uniref:hypothetical protein n=1 Tax=Flavobacterium sp. TaxID=239 RepID=UPI0039E5B470
MKKIFPVLFMLFCLNSFAQTKAEITGKWTIVKVYKIDLATPEELQQVDGFIANNWAMEFREDGVMVASPGNASQVTTWEFDEKTKKMILKSQGKSLPVEILSYQPNTMRINMSLEGRTAEFGMQKK